MTGVERLKSMIVEGPIKKPLFQIFMYLKTRIDMDEKFLNPEKSMSQMYEYIVEQVKKQASDDVAMIDSRAVFGLAIHYFDESNETLGLNKKEETKVNVTKKVEPIKAIPKIETPKEEDNQISFFGGEI